MITSIGDKGLKKFFEDGDQSGLPAQQISRIKLILAVLNQVSKPGEMNFPGSDFHPLKGDRKGEYAVKVTGNYRITFKFDKKTGNAFDVNYEDYHQQHLASLETAKQLRTIIIYMIKMNNPPHPGAVLKGLYLDGVGLSVTQAAEALGVSRKTLSQIVNGHAGISPQMAITLAQAFPTTTPQLWLNLQQQYDLWQVEQKNIPKISPLWNGISKTLAQL